MPLLTLAAARSALWKYASVIDPVAATTADKLAVTSVINQVCERFLTNQKVRGSFTRVTLPVYDGFVTLPAHLQTILQANALDADGIICGAYRIFNAWDLSKGYNGAACGGLYDIGEGYVGSRTLSGTFKIRVTVSSTEPGTTTILLRGADANGNVAYTAAVEGISLTIPASGSATTTAEFLDLDYWVKSAPTNGPITLSLVDSTSGEVMQFAYIVPGNMVSNYRRYYAPGVATTYPPAAISALCKHAYVPAVADNDAVIPSHTGALKLGMMALQAEDKWDDDRSEKWMNKALKILDDDRAEYDGDSAFGNFSVVGDFGAGCVPAIL